ncbi:DegT/DnrJ/EryC1/StrS family aminotransferase [Sphingomonas sp. RIT328]|uniref:DegT/DnrJ/EryC1/StrS family aminotransferase n=1 Tax=Sphingomonas sp. RIT328 TaxID=1470591 RepID=UPI00044A826E|nr:DegT/DnrJ/EryC1/StrS family aminotransferase [Sphingomonas sp. RIT328]EZP55123.1 DegT/DnrJ/EryC1/StrS aminotransferase [Sphingomonas sp. RIT328]
MPDRLFLSPPHMGPNEQLYVDEVFRSNWIAPIGPFVDRFEDDLAALTGMNAMVALSSGTAALHLALRLSGLRPGDEVWGSTMTFIGGVAPILYEQARPVFLDVDAKTLLLDLDLLEEHLAQRAGSRDALPKVVISTDLYGSAIDATRMRALADRFGFLWISDSAESVGSHWNGQHAGYGADFLILSFNGNKIITTSGGGALGCADPAKAAEARFLATQARDPAPHYEHTTFGYNYRLSNVCAAIGVAQLEVLEARVEARRAINAAYRRALGDRPGFFLHNEPETGRANRWLTTIEIDPIKAGIAAEAIRLALEAKNIESRPVWKPMHLQPVFASASAIGGDCAARAFARGLCLPSGSAMTQDDVARVLAVIDRLSR